MQQFITIEKDPIKIIKNTDQDTNYSRKDPTNLKKRNYIDDSDSSKLLDTSRRPITYADMLKQNATPSTAPVLQKPSKKQKKAYARTLSVSPDTSLLDAESQKRMARESRFNSESAQRESRLLTQSIINKRAKV